MRNRDKSRERMGFAGTSPSWGDKRIRKRLEALFSRAKTARERADHRRFPVWPLTIRLPSKQAFFGLCAPECASGVASRETRGTALKAGWSGEYNRRCGRFEWRCREPGRDVGAGGTQPAAGHTAGLKRLRAALQDFPESRPHTVSRPHVIRPYERFRSIRASTPHNTAITLLAEPGSISGTGPGGGPANADVATSDQASDTPNTRSFRHAKDRLNMKQSPRSRY